ncbi:MAG: aldehyde dehydrogenase family protein [Planctomycetes bacterium]|nr:aldehyde dehydrogenase family protein [Planctomycetota bacterium]
MAERYFNWIGGQWVAARSGEIFQSLNPARLDDVIGEFPASDGADVGAAVEAAREALEGWRKMPAPKRGEILFKAGEILKARKESLAREMTREMGKPLRETLGDVQEAIDTAYYAAGEGRRLAGETVPAELPNKFAMSVRCPVGVCGLITPWNFPMAIPAWKTFPALICGNTVVFKPAKDTPLLATRLVQILEETGVPAGVVNLVHGFGESVGKAIVEHPRVDLVSFTGSCEVGRVIAESCGRRLRKHSLEMGGKNAQIILHDANLDLALEGALWGAFGTTGQRCTATSRLIVERSIAEEFTRRFLERVQALRVGYGLDPKVDIGPLVNLAQLQRVQGYVDIGVREGAKLLCGGRPLTEGELGHGCFYAPTVLGEVQPRMRVAQEEIFGPVTAILTADGFEDALEIANGTNYGLSCSIYTRDVNRAFAAIRDLASGIVYVNSPTIGAEVQLPFGGIKNTGNGHREAGTTVLDIFSEWKTVYVDYSGRLQKAQMD